MPEPNKYQKLRQKYSSEDVDAAIKLCGKYDLEENYGNLDMLSLNLDRYGENTVESSLELQRKHRLPLDSLRDLNETRGVYSIETLENVIVMMKSFRLKKRSDMFFYICEDFCYLGQQTVDKTLGAVKNYGLPFTPFWAGFLSNLYHSNDAEKVDETLRTLKNEFIHLHRDDLIKFFRDHDFKIKD
jgi:hypothetical protein